jgi:hypothetical protein
MFGLGERCGDRDERNHKDRELGPLTLAVQLSGEAYKSGLAQL